MKQLIINRTSAVIFFLLYFVFSANSQTLIMNEVSNGPAGNQEYVEFVVVSNTVAYDCGSTTPPCIDIRGWIFDDNSGYHGSSGVATGAVRFSQNSLWSCVPVGTIILIYNNGDRNPAIPADDLSLSDGNCRIIAPLNSTLFESNSVTPGASACSYPVSGWTSGGSWNNTLLANAGDCARIVNLAGCEVFSVCWSSDNSNNLIYFSGSAAQKVYYFNGGNPTVQSNWSSGSANPSPGLQTPGAPNNAANASYIAQFNNNCVPITPLNVTATFVNAGCTCNGSATAVSSGSIGGYTYVWYNASYNPIGQTTATATGLCAGTYHVIGRSSIGCTDTASVTVTSTSTTSVTASSAIVCQGQNASLTATPSATGGTYSWVPGGQNTQTISVSPASTTTYTVTYTLAGCSSTATATVTVSPLPVITLNSDTICAGQSAMLTAAGATTYAWNTGATVNPFTVSPLSTTTYTVTGTTAGCSATAAAMVTVNPVPVIIVNSTTICPGAIASLSASGGAAYTWSAGATATGVNTATASPVSTSTYTVTGTAAGCFSTAVATVTVNPATIITVNSPALCSGQTANLSASGADSYTWSAGPTPTGAGTADVSPATTTSYTVTGTAAGCSGTAVATVTVNPLPVITINPDTICAGESGTLTAAGAATYVWNTGAITNPLTVSPSVTTTYTVTGTTAGCSATAAGTVTVNTAPVVIVNSTTICPGSTATLTAAGATTYVWSTGANTSTITAAPLFDTIYTVTGTTAGCSNTAVSTVMIHAVLPVNAGADDSVCFAGNTMLAASPDVAGFSYSWSPVTGLSNAGVYDPTATPPATTTYVVTVIDTNGCSTNDSVIIYADPQLSIALSSTPVLCNGSTNGQANVIASGGSGIYSYTWSSGDATATINQGAGTYAVVVTDSWGCTGTDSTIITEPTALAASATAVNVTCAGACNGTATAAATGGTTGASGYSYLWNTSPAQTTATATALCAGTYTCMVKDLNNCSVTTIATITEPEPVLVDNMPDQNVCNNGTVTLNATVHGGTGAYTYSWTPATGLSDPAINNPVATTTVTTVYTVQATDANGCSASASVTVAVNPPLAVVTQSGASVCPGNSTVLSATASFGSITGYTYAWTPAISLDNAALPSPQATPAATTTYTVTVTDACLSTATATETVTVLPLPTPVLTADVRSGCAPLCVQFTDTTGITPGAITGWNWTFGDGGTDALQSTSHCYPNDGSYTVALTVTGANGCSNTVTQNNYIQVFPLPEAAFTSNVTEANLFDPTINFINETSGAVSCNWTFGDAVTSTQVNPSHTYNDAGTYPVWLVAATDKGCIDSVMHTVVIQGEFTFFAPNAFTPDDDLTNNMFLPKGIGWDPAKYELMVFDRWGNTCFETKDVNKGWNGIVKNGSEVAQMDVYVWKVMLWDVFGKKHSYTGTVTIAK